MPEERPFVRAGWFRGPRGAVVFSYSCPDCQAVSRWYRAVHPEITLNPRKWGRLCGETEDLKMWLARYLGVRLRVCCPLDWDHVWTEVAIALWRFVVSDLGEFVDIYSTAATGGQEVGVKRHASLFWRLA